MLSFFFYTNRNPADGSVLQLDSEKTGEVKIIRLFTRYFREKINPEIEKWLFVVTIHLAKRKLYANFSNIKNALSKLAPGYKKRTCSKWIKREFWDRCRINVCIKKEWRVEVSGGVTRISGRIAEFCYDKYDSGNSNNIVQLTSWQRNSSRWLAVTVWGVEGEPEATSGETGTRRRSQITTVGGSRNTASYSGQATLVLWV